MAEQIKVSFLSMAAIEKKMSNLNKKLQNRKLTIRLNNTKGSAADSIMESAAQLDKIKTVLLNLTSNTEQIIKNSRTSFEDVDVELAKRFREWLQDIIEVK